MKSEVTGQSLESESGVVTALGAGNKGQIQHLKKWYGKSGHHGRGNVIR